MDTYGDMVTLLLCFFVMLFSMSKMDESKWIALVQALNPSAVVNGTSMEEPPEGSVVTQDQVDRDMEQLYQAMAEYFQQENMMEKVSIGKGNGYVFISFNDTVFFRPNEYTLLDEGKEVLDQVARSIAEVGPSINEIRVLGHTAQATANEENDYTVDRFLASNRATVVTVYLQEKEIIDPARLVSVGYGQWRPISSNAIPEERAKNRRVELIVTGLDLDALAGDDQAVLQHAGEYRHAEPGVPAGRAERSILIHTLPGRENNGGSSNTKPDRRPAECCSQRRDGFGSVGRENDREKVPKI